LADGAPAATSTAAGEQCQYQDRGTRRTHATESVLPTIHEFPPSMPKS
jgi:hypothetical protein